MPDNSASPNGPQQNGPPLDQLSMLLANLPRQGSPLAGLTPNPAPMPVLQGSTQDLEQRAAQPRQPAAPAPQPPQPSDDPAITSARAGMDASSQRLQDQMSQFDKTRQQIAAVPPVNAADYRPKWTDRLLGGITGALSGFRDPAEGVKIGGSITNRSLNRAQSERQSQLAPLLEQLNTEREEIPMLTQANESAWRQFGAAKDTANLNREAQRDKDLAQYHDDIADIRKEMTEGNIQKAQDLLDQKQKELELKQKNGEDISNYREGMLGLREQMLELKEKQGDDKTKVKPQMIENKRDTAWGRAKREYDSSVSKIDPTDKEGVKQAQEDYYEKLQDAQDQYEQDIGVNGGTAEHVDIPRNHFGEQGATAKPQAKAAAPAAKSSTPAKSISMQGLQKAAQDHFGGDVDKAKAQFLKDNPGATVGQ